MSDPVGVAERVDEYVRASGMDRETAAEKCARVMASAGASSNALRFNGGKPRLSLLPDKALIAEARVWECGERKYGRDNWRKLWGKDTKSVVLDSALRHLVAMLAGEDRDPETGCYHAAHVRCNMAMIIEYLEMELKLDPAAKDTV